MAERNFLELLKARWAEGKFVCVGLDSDYEQISKKVKETLKVSTVLAVVIKFNQEIIKATADLVCAYKPNIAFYEKYYGTTGILPLERTLYDLQKLAPQVPVILDAKRGDIGNTNQGYVAAVFQHYQADATTVHPYLGHEALQPFLDQKDKGIFVLCRTSNPGAGEFQDLEVKGMPLYLYVASQVAQKWNQNGNCGLVVGATYPGELEQVRKTVGDLPILIPGIGAQGGDVEKTVRAGLDNKKEGIIVNSSRGIIFASKGDDFAEAARRETLKLSEMINQYR